ncbi:MAG: DnaA/Hda family protein, partial [Desulfobacterales bacterium]|nr:DnaA/Hda family protein [Desulfobacterales bacterium]
MENRTAPSTNGPDPWSACLISLERDLPPQQFATWIRPLRCEPTADGVRLVAPNRFVLQWVKDRFGPRISTMLRDATGNDLGVEFVIAPPGDTRRPPESVAREPAAPLPAPAVVAVAPPPAVAPRRSEPSSLNPALTFDSFVTGKANQLARAAALQIAEHPTSYNPLFIYGGVGLGKTHLIQAVGNHILAQNPAAKIRYTHAESYIADVVRAYQHKSFEEFKRHYRSLDLLLIDDIQFLGGKSRTQE